MREIFIAKRRNKEGRRFGFVRFKGVSDVIKEVSDGGHASRTRNPLVGEWTDEITSEEDGDAREDEDDDTSFSYSPELSSAKNRLPSDHQVPVLPNGSSDQAPDHPHLLGNNPQVQNYTEKSAEAGNASQGFFRQRLTLGIGVKRRLRVLLP